MLAELLANMSVLSIVLFIVGIVLLILEMIEPGFGICGICGIVVLIVDIFITAKSVAQFAVMLGIIIAVAIVAFVVCVLLMSKGKFPPFLVLKSSDEKKEAEVHEGETLLNKKGYAVTAMRPVGKISIDDKLYDAVSVGKFIDADSEIIVVETVGNKITVKQI